MITTEEREYLLSSMKRLLSEYDYEYTDDALNKIITEWANKKKCLIEAFKKHPNYIKGKFMIAVEREYVREANPKAIRDFMSWVHCAMDECRYSIPAHLIAQRERECCCWLPNDLFCLMDTRLSSYYEPTISKEMASRFNEVLPEIKARSGTKTTRFVNKLCTYLNYNQHPEYNKKFAEYSDALSPRTFKRFTVLSLNPLDYLTMSFGNSWSSCHTIDKENKRRMPNGYEGQYGSGTMSYMLDSVSMVLYTIDSNATKEYWDMPKINRQMFHYGNEKLIQGRLYPQSNDWYGSAYIPYREFVQEILSATMGISAWSKADEIACRDTYSWGTHYRDYDSFDNCRISIVEDSTNTKAIEIGAYPICISCGRRHRKENNIHCDCKRRYRCSKCGRVHETKDDVTFIDGYAYCNSCITWCDCCKEYHGTTSYYIKSENINVCAHCRSKYYTSCDYCGDYVPLGELTHTKHGDICHDCLTDLTAQN